MKFHQLALLNRFYFAGVYLDSPTRSTSSELLNPKDSTKGSAPTPSSSSRVPARLVVIAGPPAAGKGTQCELIVQEFGFAHVSTGKAFC